MRRAILSIAFVALFLHIFVGIAETTYTENETLISPLNCTSDMDCMVEDKFSICEFFNTTGNELEGRCVCDADKSYYKNVDECVFHARLGDICRPGETVCVTAHTECLQAGENQGRHRCKCPNGYVEVEHNSLEQCARIIHSAIDPTCSTCESNGGICYYADDDASQYRCICPEYTSGDDCQNSHVNVTCDASRWSMVVCYSPHSWFNVSAGGIMMVEGIVDEACKAVVAAEKDRYCQSGQLKLVLPLGGARRRMRCKTVEIVPEILTKKYENLIVVQKKLAVFSPGDFTFRASCAFQSHANTEYKPVSMDGMIMDGRDIHHAAQLNLVVENQLGQTLPEHIPIRVGDKIRLLISLVDNSVFTAIKVMGCLASSSPFVSDPKAVIRPLLSHSCPAADQTYLTNENNWQRISDEPSRLQTGLIVMFMLPQGKSLHLHCSVKLCVKRIENDCDPVACEAPTYGLAYDRRKRSPETKSVMVSRKLIWYEKKPTETITGPKDPEGSPMMKFPISRILIGVLAAFTVLVVLVVGLLVCKLRRRKTRRQMRLTEHSYLNYRY